MKTLLRNTKSMRTKLTLLLTALALILSTTSFAQRPTVGGQANDFTLVNSAGEVISLSDLQGTPVILNFWATWCVPCREELPFFQTTYDEINSISDAHSMLNEMTEDSSEAPSESSEDTVVTTTDSETTATDGEQTDANMSDNTENVTDEMAEELAKKLHFVIVNNNEDAKKATTFLEEININLTSLVDASKDERNALLDVGTELDKTIDVVKDYRVRGMPTTFYIDADGVIQVIKQGLITPQSMQQDLAKIGIDWQPTIEENNDG